MCDEGRLVLQALQRRACPRGPDRQGQGDPRGRGRRGGGRPAQPFRQGHAGLAGLAHGLARGSPGGRAGGPRRAQALRGVRRRARRRLARRVPAPCRPESRPCRPGARGPCLRAHGEAVRRPGRRGGRRQGEGGLGGGSGASATDLAAKLARAEALVVQAVNEGDLAGGGNRAPARVARAGVGRHLRELRGSAAALRDGLLAARRVAAALGALRRGRAGARTRLAVEQRTERVRGPGAARGRGSPRVPLERAPLESTGARGSSRSPPERWTGGCPGTGSACPSTATETSSGAGCRTPERRPP